MKRIDAIDLCNIGGVDYMISKYESEFGIKFGYHDELSYWPCAIIEDDTASFIKLKYPDTHIRDVLSKYL